MYVQLQDKNTVVIIPEVGVMLFFFLSAEHLSHHQSARAYMLSWYELNNRQVLCICLDGGRNRALVLCVIASLSGKTHTLHCSWKKAS